MTKHEDVEYTWKTIDWTSLPESAKVDITQFIAGLKPAVRTKLTTNSCATKLVRIISSLNWYYALDDDGYLVIARDKNLPHIIMEVDQSISNHEEDLGLLLGYPLCCCCYVSKIVGEECIDNISSARAYYLYNKHNKFLDVTNYLDGISLLSHLPCSLYCLASFELSLRMKNFIENHIECEFFSLWGQKISNYFSF